MRPHQALSAVLTASLLLCVAPAAAGAAGTVAAGTVREANGEPARTGTVALLADPSASGARRGQLTLVARSAIRDGRFAVSAPAAAVAGHPADASGFRDWQLIVRTPRGTTRSLFSASEAAPARLRLRASSARPRVARVSQVSTCHYELDRQVDRRVRMSDVHAWKGVSSTFTYAAGHSADTYVGAAIQTPGGKWKVSGTDHVTNAKVFGQTVTARGRQDRKVSGVFKFNIVKEAGRGCDPDEGPKKYTRAYRFEGDMRLGRKSKPANRGLSGRCNKAPGRRKLFPHASYFTSTARSFTYERSFTLVGLTLGSSTTFSKNAQIELKSHVKYPIWVCGLSLSGQAVPISTAAMMYAGPRVKRKHKK